MQGPGCLRTTSSLLQSCGSDRGLPIYVPAAVDLELKDLRVVIISMLVMFYASDIVYCRMR